MDISGRTPPRRIPQHLSWGGVHIVEMQTVQNYPSNTYDHFAVQVHRGVDSQKVDFEVEPKDWQSIDSHNVRGATSAEGEDLLLTPKFDSCLTILS